LNAKSGADLSWFLVDVLGDHRGRYSNHAFAFRSEIAVTPYFCDNVALRIRFVDYVLGGASGVEELLTIGNYADTNLAAAA